jgi:hypothetical protein
MIVETVTGSVYTSSVEDYDDNEVEELQKICKNIKAVSYFSFKDESGCFVFFNPDHIVVAAMRIIEND